MKTLRQLLLRTTHGNSRFGRYYGGILQSGAGYPTADEARRDMRTYERTMTTLPWPR